MLTATISLALGGSLLVFLLLLVTALAAAVFFYRYTLPPLPLARRLVLTVLRSLALTLLLLVLFEPVFRLVSRSEQAPGVAVLVDDSQSIAIKDGSGDRATGTRLFLAEQPWARTPAGLVTHYYTFSSSLKEAPNFRPESLAFKGEETDLARAVEGLKDKLTGENIQALVLVTDGNYTTGKNPLYAAEALGIPVFTVGVGDTTEQKDVLVENVLTNEITYAETRVPVDITLKSSGYNGERVEVSVSEGRALLDRTVVTLLDGTRRYPVRLFVTPKEEGMKKYVVQVSSLPGELTEKNNQRQFFMKVLKSKLRVVLLAGAPSPDVAALRQAIAEDEHMTVRAFIQKRAGEFYDAPPAREQLDSADCMMLVGFPSASTSRESLELVRAHLEREKKPLFFVSSRTIDYGKLAQLEPFLPFSWIASGPAELSVFAQVPERQKFHPLVSLEGGVSLETWHDLPPIYKAQTVFRAKPDADIVALAGTQNSVLGEPLVASRSISHQKVLAITGYGIWRWGLLAQTNTETEHFLPSLVSNTIRWLTTREEDKQVRIAPRKEAFTTAENVEFTGQVYDEQLRPVDDAEVIVEISRTQGGEKFQLALTAQGNGRYAGSFEGASEGEYSYTGKASAGGKVYGEDRGKFSVGQLSAEYVSTKLNAPLLEQIAERTGGRYHGIGEAADLARELSSGRTFIPREIVHASEIELWNWKYIAGAVIAILALEWFLRKRNGML
jgi:hypothetical protein